MVLGEALNAALGDRSGIRRYGSFLLPMDETLVLVALDLSGRPYLVYEVTLPAPQVKDIDARLFREFFQALVNTSGITVHVDLLACEESHHGLEAIYKAFGRALKAAVSLGGVAGEVPSTKGVL